MSTRDLSYDWPTPRVEIPFGNDDRTGQISDSEPHRQWAVRVECALAAGFGFPGKFARGQLPRTEAVVVFRDAPS